MITKKNLKKSLEYLKFTESDNIYTKKFDELDCELKADFNNEQLIYPENKGFTVNERQTCNFKQAENFVVFECVHKLLSQGYNPIHIELEPKWQVGHGASGGRADILVKDNDDKALLIIECKTAGNEFTKAWNTTQTKPTQLFSYVQQTKSTKFISLYASDFIDEKIISNYYLINVIDNEELLLNNPKLKSFKDATTVEEIYQIWNDTYDKEYTKVGIFEKNKPYEIGKSKFNISDLQPVSSKDIQEKYNKFATILRKYNVSGRENAFDKLVNLFLCKVVDEKQNSNELKFYWKGKAYDNPFDFQDRLQQLYKEGMKEFLGEDITYIDNNQIDSIFKHYDLDTIKKSIKDVLKEQKFFTNNDFAFIDVHNEKLFYQNFHVLLDIARLIQEINLTSSDENQFLGDMFEGFLDQGVKQSEGQFFTPMPIVKFIINSLPKKEIPKVIDYACGAGHFLNEYFTTNKQSKIIGIEKEYRLSKVAKVSSFMYASEMNIVYSDALVKNEKIKDNNFDVLIANPPYSVKGFLETLSDEERNKFELINTIDEKSYTANNAIECFFIERAKQLLSKDAVAGIVVPSSILNKGSQNINTNKGNVYVGTREIILKYFDIVAIAEFGSGTFGKTGTNTVTLFLKRRCDIENTAGTFEELSQKLYKGKLEFQEVLQDKEMLEKYCSYLEMEFKIYLTLICGDLNNEIFEYEIFKEYLIEFEKLTETKNRKKKAYYKNLDTDEKEKLEQKELLKYIREIEKDKFYYFCLAYKNSIDVIIVKSPSNNNENKKFLGYEWSSAKGNEGIHYITKSSFSIDDETLDEADIRILENLQGLKNINTPLYNPSDIEDDTKINKIIADNFNGIETKIPHEQQKYVSRAILVDMLDFSRVEFNKALSLSPSKKVEIESKWDIVKLDEIINLHDTLRKPIKESDRKKGNFPYYGATGIIDYINGYTHNGRFLLIGEDGAKWEANENSSFIVDGKFWANNHVHVLKVKENVRDVYLREFLNQTDLTIEYITGLTVKKLNQRNLLNIKIPLPPLDIQEQIVKECQKIDDEVLQANKNIKQAQQDIILAMESSKENNTMKLGEACELKAGKFVSASDINDEDGDNLYPCYGGNGLRGYTKTFTHDGTYPLIGRQGALCGNITLVHGKFHATEHAVVVTSLVDIEVKWLYHQLIILNLNQYATGTAQPGLSVKNINAIPISIPTLKVQKQIVSKIENLEAKINEAKQIVDNAQVLKENILKKFL